MIDIDKWRELEKPEDYARQIPDEINRTALKTVENKSFPYFYTPLPQDINLVTGERLTDMNRVNLELKAAERKAKDLEWLYAADAANLGLVMKETDASPILITHLIGRNEALQPVCEIQSAYFLSDFTEESIIRAMNKDFSKENELTDTEKNRLANTQKNFIRNMAEYNSGRAEADLRRIKRANIKENLERNKLAKESYERVTSALTSPQKEFFNTMLSYYNTQMTGLRRKEKTGQEIDAEKNTVREMAEEKNSALTELMTGAALYSERATHKDFTFDMDYGQNYKKENITLPKAGKFEEEPEIERNRTAKRESKRTHSRDNSLKPHSITISRGR